MLAGLVAIRNAITNVWVAPQHCTSLTVRPETMFGVSFVRESYVPVTRSGSDLLRGGFIRADGSPRFVSYVTPARVAGVVRQQTGITCRMQVWPVVSRYRRFLSCRSVIGHHYFPVSPATAVVPYHILFVDAYVVSSITEWVLRASKASELDTATANNFSGTNVFTSHRQPTRWFSVCT